MLDQQPQKPEHFDAKAGGGPKFSSGEDQEEQT
jgi:hypothetical protein